MIKKDGVLITLHVKIKFSQKHASKRTERNDDNTARKQRKEFDNKETIRSGTRKVPRIANKINLS